MTFKKFFNESKYVSHGSDDYFQKIDFNKIRTHGNFGWGMFFGPLNYNTYARYAPYSYKVKLDLDKNNTLNCFKTVNQQSQSVKNILFKNFLELYKKYENDNPLFLYREIDKSPKKSSETLSKLGIKGMALSHDLFNNKIIKRDSLIYCVFDPSVIHIIETKKQIK